MDRLKNESIETYYLKLKHFACPCSIVNIYNMTPIGYWWGRAHAWYNWGIARSSKILRWKFIVRLYEHWALSMNIHYRRMLFASSLSSNCLKTERKSISAARCKSCIVEKQMQIVEPMKYLVNLRDNNNYEELNFFWQMFMNSS